MTSKLKRYFPIIREREEILEEILQSDQLRNTFEIWPEERQEEFLDFCAGIRGLKILYDTFFKEILHPTIHRERLASFISAILGQKIKILQVLPLESPRIADETSLLLMDIVVQLEDGTIVNIEMQKVGYAFPGQRCACYSADLLLRQYKYLKDQKDIKFSYRDIKTVCTIVIFEKSPEIFRSFPEHYIHRFSQQSDTGLQLDLLQNFYLIPLDIFQKRPHNNLINTPTEAWLSFLSTDDPEQIITLLEAFPEFKEIYQDIYEICCNIERVMQMFSKELQELDRNTVEYMIDEMQEELNTAKTTIKNMGEYIAEVEEQKAEAERQKAEAERQKAEAERQKVKDAQRIAELEHLLAEATKKYPLNEFNEMRRL